MTKGIKTIIYPVNDLDAAKQLFTALIGSDPAQDTPYYVGWDVSGQDIGLDPNGHRNGATSPTGYWHVDDIQQTLKELTTAGATQQQDVRDVGGGRLIATVTDADGNVIGLLQP